MQQGENMKMKRKDCGDQKVEPIHMHKKERRKRKNTSKINQHLLEVTANEAIHIINKWDKNPSACDPTKSAFDAVLMYYANSGYFQFGKFNEYCQSKNGKTVDEKALKEEILDEKLNNK